MEKEDEKKKRGKTKKGEENRRKNLDDNVGYMISEKKR